MAEKISIADLKEAWNESWARLKKAVEEPFVVETVVASGKIETYITGDGKLNWDAVFANTTIKPDADASKVKVAVATRRDLLDGDSFTFVSEDPDLVPILPDLVKVHQEAQKAALEQRQQNLDWLGRWINLINLAV
jgi:hypothetical protein